MLSNLIKLVPKFSFAKEVAKAGSGSTGSANLTHYKDGQLVNRSQLVLKQKEDVEAYVIKTVQNYFRTTYKNGKANIII
jgi:hypothetical protein